MSAPHSHQVSGAESAEQTERMLPCPSCGEEDVDATFALNGEGGVQAGCMVCEMCGPTSHIARDAVDRWNALPRRADVSDRDAKMEAHEIEAYKVILNQIAELVGVETPYGALPDAVRAWKDRAERVIKERDRLGREVAQARREGMLEALAMMRRELQIDEHGDPVDAPKPLPGWETGYWSGVMHTYRALAAQINADTQAPDETPARPTTASTLVRPAESAPFTMHPDPEPQNLVERPATLAQTSTQPEGYVQQAMGAPLNAAPQATADSVGGLDTLRAIAPPAPLAAAAPDAAPQEQNVKREVADPAVAAPECVVESQSHALFWGHYGSAAGWLEALANGAEFDDDQQTAVYARYAARELAAALSAQVPAARATGGKDG